MSSGAPLSLVRLTWRHTEGVRPLLWLCYVLSLAFAISRLALPVLVGLAINAFQTRGMHLTADGDWRAVALFLVLLFGWTIRLPSKMAQLRVAVTVRSAFLRSLITQLFSSPLKWHDENHSGDTLSRLNQSSGALYSYALGQFRYLESAVLLVGPLIVLYNLSPRIFAISLVCYALIAGICLAVDWIQQGSWLREAEKQRVLSTTLIDSLRNVLSIYAGRRQDLVRGTLADQVVDHHQAAHRNALVTEFKWAAVDVLATIVTFGLVVLYIWDESASGHLALGQAFMVLAFLQGGFSALLEVAGNITAYVRAKTEVQAAAPIILAVPEPQVVATLPADWHRLELDQVDFEYNVQGVPRRVLH